MRLFKKRKCVFTGIRPWERPSSSLEAPAEALVERPVPLETASSKKLAITSRCQSSAGPSRSQASPSTCELCSSTGMPEELESEDDCQYVGHLKGYRLLDCEDMIQVASGLGCLSWGLQSYSRKICR